MYSKTSNNNRIWKRNSLSIFVLFCSSPIILSDLIFNMSFIIVIFFLNRVYRISYHHKKIDLIFANINFLQYESRPKLNTTNNLSWVYLLFIICRNKKCFPSAVMAQRLSPRSDRQTKNNLYNISK
jgi:hypothetical protein